MSIWTVEVTRVLIEENEKKRTAQEIANTLSRLTNTPVTRNMVIGKRKRIGLEGLPQGRWVERKRRTQPMNVKPRVRKKKIIEAPLPVRTAPIPCSWPMWGDMEKPTREYCGAPSMIREDGKIMVYCQEHCRRAFTPVNLAREQRRIYQVIR